MPLLNSAFTVYNSPEHVPLLAPLIQRFREDYLIYAKPTAEREEEQMNISLTNALTLMVEPIGGRIERGTPEEPHVEMAQHCVQIKTNIDVSKGCALDCPPYKLSDVQQIVRAFRYSSQSTSSSATGSTSPSGGDGIIRPDLVVRVRHSPSSTALVSLVGENKVDTATKPNARAKQGFAQLLLQILLAHEAYGTYLGTAICKTQMTRVFVLGSRAVAVEGKDGGSTAPEVSSIRQFLRRTDHFDQMPHDLSTDSGFRTLWSIVADAVQLLGAQPADRPLQRLLLPPCPVALALLKLLPTGVGAREVDGYGAEDDARARWERDVQAAWATCRRSKAFAQIAPGYFAAPRSSPSQSSASSTSRTDGSTGNAKRRRTKGIDPPGERSQAPEGAVQSHDSTSTRHRTAAIASWAAKISREAEGVDEEPSGGLDGPCDDELEVGADANSYPSYGLYESVLYNMGITIVMVPTSTMDDLLSESRSSSANLNQVDNLDNLQPSALLIPSPCLSHAPHTSLTA